MIFYDFDPFFLILFFLSITGSENDKLFESRHRRSLWESDDGVWKHPVHKIRTSK